MSVAGLVLAAGRAVRFGGVKQLAELDGRPLVAHVVAAATDAALDPVHVVVGHAAEEVAEALDDDVVVVTNPAYAAGQSTSLSAGLSSLTTTDADAVVVLLADEPDVSSHAIQAVLDAHDDGAAIVRCRYADRPGHPVLLARSVWPAAIDAATADHGALPLFDRDDAVEVDLDGAGPTDVDTRADLAALET